MITLRHIRYFIAVAEEMHFSRAAERLHMAQPPLSQQIRQLEQLMGVDLFQRTKRRVQLTAAGQAFLTECRLLLQQLDQAVLKAQQANRGEYGTLTIGFVSSASYSVLPKLLRQFRQTYPDVNVVLRELSASLQSQAIDSRSIDISIARSAVDSINAELAATIEESLIVAMPSGHELSRAKTVSLEELAREPFILFPRSLSPALYDQIISLCRSAGFSPKVVQEAIQMQTIIGLVVAEIGVAIVPESLHNLRRAGVVYRALRGRTPRTKIIIANCKGEKPEVVRNFLEIVKAVRTEGRTTPRTTLRVKAERQSEPQ